MLVVFLNSHLDTLNFEVELYSPNGFCYKKQIIMIIKCIRVDF